MAKHPAERSKPFAAVELADEPVRLKYGVERPFNIVEVAFATKFAAPLIEKMEPGVVLAMPTKPLVLMVSAGTVEVAKVLGLEVAM